MFWVTSHAPLKKQLFNGFYVELAKYWDATFINLVQNLIQNNLSTRAHVWGRYGQKSHLVELTSLCRLHDSRKWIIDVFTFQLLLYLKVEWQKIVTWHSKWSYIFVCLISTHWRPINTYLSCIILEYNACVAILISHLKFMTL